MMATKTNTTRKPPKRAPQPAPPRPTPKTDYTPGEQAMIEASRAVVAMLIRQEEEERRQQHAPTV